ncbi:Hypothetical predicted protein [Xyrichtys novacula]|uniref:Uncharacterized protein n=1 Tax=Xyrichtys novacula TaxID=13765 RepID=A0AAV1HKH0_XYRNO|nr:Hypothetical predicted protein [Xyrichtys novacula]
MTRDQSSLLCWKCSQMRSVGQPFTAGLGGKVFSTGNRGDYSGEEMRAEERGQSMRLQCTAPDQETDQQTPDSSSVVGKRTPVTFCSMRARGHRRGFPNFNLLLCRAAVFSPLGKRLI